MLAACHLAPDGDSLGSLSALAALLGEHGHEAVLYNPDPIPRALRFLPYMAKLVHKLPKETAFDLTIVVDVGDRALLGDRFPGREISGPLLVLDHHASARPFGDLFICDPAASSVGVLVARLAAQLGWTISPTAALGIYTSIVADTGSFRFANTNAEAFRLAADLVEHRAVNPAMIAEQLGERVPLARWKLLAAALSAIELELEQRVAILIVTKDMLDAAGANWEDSEGFANYARAIDTVRCGVLLTPARGGGIRASMRSVLANSPCERAKFRSKRGFITR
ncbi:MAG: DHH family phosphoesterase [Pseudomonadota bacterium]